MCHRQPIGKTERKHDICCRANRFSQPTLDRCLYSLITTRSNCLTSLLLRRYRQPTGDRNRFVTDQKHPPIAHKPHTSMTGANRALESDLSALPSAAVTAKNEAFRSPAGMQVFKKLLPTAPDLLIFHIRSAVSLKSRIRPAGEMQIIATGALSKTVL